MRHAAPHVLAGAAATIALFAFTCDSAFAQRRGRRNRIPPTSAVLQGITSASCSFTASARGMWPNGGAEVAVQPRATTLSLTITEIDSSTGTAMLAGPDAPVEVTVQLVGSNLHILDIRPAGALAITTLFAEESRDGRLKAVHSRSDYAGGAVRGGAGSPPDVSQYYGDCAVSPR